MKRVSAMADFDAIHDRHCLIANGEAARIHRDWFPRFRDCYHWKTVEKLELGRAVSDAALARARSECERFSTAMTRLMDAQAIDLWISPSAVGPAPPGLESTGDPVMNLPWSQARFPTISLPCGHAADGLPLGLQLTARFNEDERLLVWAGELEATLAMKD